MRGDRPFKYTYSAIILFRVRLLYIKYWIHGDPLSSILNYCTLGWSDLALFAIFENRHIAADQPTIYVRDARVY